METVRATATQTVNTAGNYTLAVTNTITGCSSSTVVLDITITPKKDSVSIIRKKQFALIKAATKTRIDLGLKYKNKPTTARLLNSGPFGAMCTHRIILISI